MKVEPKLITELVEHILGKLVSYATKSEISLGNVIHLKEQLTEGVCSLELEQQQKLVTHFVTNKFLRSILDFSNENYEKEDELCYNILLFNESSPIDPFLVSKFLVSFLIEIKNSTSEISEEVTQQEPLTYSNDNADIRINPQYEYENYYESYRFGNKHKKRLGLSAEEVKHLNKVWIGDTVFTEIQQCADESAKMFLYLLNKLDVLFKEKGKNLFDLLDRLDKKENIYGHDYLEYSSEWWTPATSRTFNDIFKIAENAVRTNYRHTRKRDEESSYLQLEMDLKIDLKECFKTAINQYNSKIQQPSEETVLKLNELNRTRWKTTFQLIKSNFKSLGPELTTQKMSKLLAENKYNPSISSIYFEATKIFVEWSRQETLKYYIHYFALKNQNNITKIKPLPKSIDKKLFTKEQYRERFNQILTQLSNDSRLDKAIASVVNVYKKERKRISLDESAINKINETHKETVEKLNIILTDEETISKIELINEEEVASFQNEEKGLDDIFGNMTEEDTKTSFQLDEPQLELLKLFIEKSLVLTEQEVSDFAKEKRKLKGQLVNRINDQFYEQYEEVLIEDSETGYKLNEDYIELIKSLNRNDENQI